MAQKEDLLDRLIREVESEIEIDGLPQRMGEQPDVQAYVPAKNRERLKTKMNDVMKAYVQEKTDEVMMKRMRERFPNMELGDVPME